MLTAASVTEAYAEDNLHKNQWSKNKDLISSKKFDQYILKKKSENWTKRNTATINGNMKTKKKKY